MLYTAIIVEPRQHKALPFVLENFLNNLSEDWSFIIFHGTTNLEFIINIINDKLSKHIHRIKLMKLNVYNLTIQDYNNLLKYNKYFYDCIPTDTFLIFQTDSILIEKYNHFINNFLHYDYVGAPWNHFPLNNNDERVGNGGLSLRKKSKMIEIMEKQGKSDYPEDVYFSCYNYVATHKPSVNDAMFFSIEETFSEMSFGCHKPWKNSNQLFLYETYDEVKQLYYYNDISPPLSVVEPVVAVVAAVVPQRKPVVAVVAAVVPQRKPVVEPVVAVVAAVVPQRKPVVAVVPPKPVVKPVVAVVPPKPVVKPVVAVVPPKPVVEPVVAVVVPRKPVVEPVVAVVPPKPVVEPVVAAVVPPKPVVKPVVAVVPPKPVVEPVVAVVVPRKPVVEPVVAVVAPRKPVVEPVVAVVPPKPVVEPVVAVVPPKPIIKPEVVIDSNPKGYKIARIEKEQLKELYSYNNYSFFKFLK